MTGQGSQGGQAGHDLDRKLGRAEASHAVTGLGWRLRAGRFRTEVLTGSLPLAADVAARAAAVAGRRRGTCGWTSARTGWCWCCRPRPLGG